MAGSAPHTILVVDDSPTDLLLLKHILETNDCAVVAARTGEEAVALAPTLNLALIILDVQMPGLNGYETAEKLRLLDSTRHTPIIFVTASQLLEEHVFRGYDSSAVDYLFKPVEKNLLLGKARVFCELHEQKTIIERQLGEIRTKNQELQRRLDEIKILRGMIPICVSCKKVRDDSGYWEAIETYLRSFSEAEFSHGLCPDCAIELYPELYQPQSKPLDAP